MKTTPKNETLEQSSNTRCTFQMLIDFYEMPTEVSQNTW